MTKLKIETVEGNKIILLDSKNNEYEATLSKEIYENISFAEKKPERQKQHLSPREIQDRLRAGIPKEKISEISTSSLASIERLSEPIEMEKNFVFETFRKTRIKNGKKTPVNSPNEYTYWNLFVKELSNKFHIYYDVVEWEITRINHEPWNIVGSFFDADVKREIHFEFDLENKTVIAKNELTKELLSPVTNTGLSNSELLKKVTGQIDILPEHQIQFGSNTPTVLFSSQTETNNANQFTPTVNANPINTVNEVAKPEFSQATNIPNQSTQTPLTPQSQLNNTNTATSNTSTIKPVETAISQSQTPNPQLNQSPVFPEKNETEKVVEPTVDPNRTTQLDTNKTPNKKNRPPLPSWDELFFGKGDN